MDAELLPCPFCGGPGVIAYGEMVSCNSEECAGNGVMTRAPAWNTRADPSPEIAELRAELRKMTIDRDVWEDCCRHDEEDKAPCGHHVSLTYSDDGGKHVHCHVCRHAALISTQRALVEALEWTTLLVESQETPEGIAPMKDREACLKARAALNLAKGAK